MLSASLMLAIAMASPPEPAKVQGDYVAKLTAAEPNADAQFHLANWARKQGLPDVADGHLRAAVHVDPRHEAAQKALGRILRDGRWESKEERAWRLAKEENLRQEYVMWVGRLKERGLDATFGQPMSDAAIAAVEAFSSQDSGLSRKAVDVFDGSNHGSATLALARLALASEFPDVRRAAAEKLSTKNPDHYLMTLLEFARPPRAGKQAVLGVGEIWYWQQGTTMFTSIPPPDRILSGGSGLSIGAGGGRIGIRVLSEPVRVKTRVEEGTLESAHRAAENVRTNAIAALQTTTGQSIGDDFDQWRSAVMNITGFHVETRGKTDQHVTTYYQPDSMTVGLFNWRIITGGSCFAAGTPVATKRGEVPIDKVCLGELVLSKNVETGETAYKPVLSRTLRPRIPMQKLAIGGETFLATAGHPFWDSAKGWVKAKNLARNASLGTETGVVSMSANDAAEPLQAYNLVVADFGTYFVGKSRLLVHDNTPIRDSK